MNPPTETRVAVISIIVEEPESVPAINELLHDYADDRHTGIG